MLLLFQSTPLKKEKHMIEHFFVHTPVVARLRGGPLGPYLDDLTMILHQQGYAPSSIQRCLRTGDRFGRWLHGQGYEPAIERCYPRHWRWHTPTPRSTPTDSLRDT